MKFYKWRIERRLSDFIDDIFVVRALLLRDLRVVYQEHPAGFLQEFFRPTIACVAHYFVFWAVDKIIPPGMSLEQYIIAAFTVWLTFIRNYATMQQTNRTKLVPFPGASRMHARLALSVWAMFSNILFCYLSVSLLKIYGDTITYPSLPLTLYILVIASVLGWGFGLFVEAACRLIPFLEPVFHLFPYLFFISTGIYFTAATEPPLMASIFLYNPVLHLIEYERYAFWPGYPIFPVSLAYPTILGFSMLAVSLALNRRLRLVAHA